MGFNRVEGRQRAWATVAGNIPRGFNLHPYDLDRALGVLPECPQRTIRLFRADQFAGAGWSTLTWSRTIVRSAGLAGGGSGGAAPTRSQVPA